MEPTIRRATAQDTDIVVQFMQEYYAFDHLAFDEVHARRAAREMIADERLGIIWLVCVNDMPVGYAVMAFIHSLEFHGRTAFLDEIYLRDAQRGKGLGKKTIAVLLDECRRRGIAALRLEVERSNAVAQSVYAKLGFEKHERHIMTKWIAS